MVKPERTAIDWIVETDTLVLARPSNQNPFAFEITRVLVGDGNAPPINNLVDSSSRCKLAAHENDAVLFAHGADVGWRQVAYVDEGFDDILDTALENRLAWRGGMPQSRIEFIATLQNSPVPAHEKIVMGELDKVPYADLRLMDIRISDVDLVGDLWTRSGYPYQAIRAVLLGLTGTPAARSEIRDYIDRVATRDWANNLGAFAAAYIELEGVSGLDHLGETMLLDLNQPLDKVEQIIMAMSVHHGLADPQLKTRIQDLIDALIAERPEAGAVVARQFSLRSDWSQSAVLEPLVRDRSVALSDLLTISVYTSRARETGVPSQGPAND